MSKSWKRDLIQAYQEAYTARSLAETAIVIQNVTRKGFSSWKLRLLADRAVSLCDRAEEWDRRKNAERTHHFLRLSRTASRQVHEQFFLAKQRS